ncbi:DUF4011 domain-containing protein [Bacillus sp. FJAT-49736]|uniref:DUF4011 domain-containing protein n=1 Tax=Bacillus sp. FJAT-49736 TaxID=2833582 RepID=UPI001BC8E0D2|nr:DUF4011 domain-containing protein [Bacillus sp. FJAT-49736]MBS4173523.1 DUF4011 domain-containing protein [Bacillus sp. FJAT-49736]MBS4175913.1 DUF4011 domain-containing protein [Bacillus sp. FJAT-49736]
MEERKLDIKIQHWKSRLLDMTKRNRLLNFKTNKSTIKISKDVNEVFDLLNNGKALMVRSLVDLEQEVDKQKKPSVSGFESISWTQKS